MVLLVNHIVRVKVTVCRDLRKIVFPLIKKCGEHTPLSTSKSNHPIFCRSHGNLIEYT